MSLSLPIFPPKQQQHKVEQLRGFSMLLSARQKLRIIPQYLFPLRLVYPIPSSYKCNLITINSHHTPHPRRCVPSLSPFSYQLRSQGHSFDGGGKPGILSTYVNSVALMVRWNCEWNAPDHHGGTDLIDHVCLLTETWPSRVKLG